MLIYRSAYKNHVPFNCSRWTKPRFPRKSARLN